MTPEPADTENYYGFGSDFDEVKGTMFTARFEHDFSDNVTIRNTTRYGRLRQFYMLTGVNAVNVPTADPNEWTVNRTRQAKFQENTLLTNQTNVTANLVSAVRESRHHGGFEFIDEEQFNPTYAPLSLGVAPPANLYNPNRNDRAAGLRAGAQRRVHARRNANRRRLHLRHAELRGTLAGHGRLPPRCLRHETRWRGTVHR